MKRIWIICLALALTFVFLPRLSLAQSTARLDARISRLEAENFQLRARLNRLESQISRVSRQTSPQVTPPRRTETAPPVSPSPGPLSDDPMFERLATLVIELKERIQTLEQQVAELQAEVDNGTNQNSVSGK